MLRALIPLLVVVALLWFARWAIRHHDTDPTLRDLTRSERKAELARRRRVREDQEINQALAWDPTAHRTPTREDRP